MNKLGKFTFTGSALTTHMGFPVILTQRQRDVLLLLCEGLSNKLIGRQLGVSGNTVKTHVASVLRSLNATTRLEAVAVAFKLGLVQPSDAEPLNGSAHAFGLGRSRGAPRLALAA
jgi:DNA-binding NarL/FixJ family response regulator